MSYWLIKSEPGEFSIDDLYACPKRTTCWDGVRNYQARNFMRDDMKTGDLAFFYHSNCDEPGISGVVSIVKAAYPDHTAFDPDDKHFDPKSDPTNPRWLMVDVRFEEKYPRVISLARLREESEGALKDFMILRRGNRLSVTPVSRKHWNYIVRLKNKLHV